LLNLGGLEIYSTVVGFNLPDRIQKEILKFGEQQLFSMQNGDQIYLSHKY